MLGSALPQREGISSTIRSANGLPPSAEGGKGWRRSHHKLVFRAFQARPKGFALALWKPSPVLYLKLVGGQRWQVAAALSSAVTTTKQQETTLQLTAAYCMEEKNNSNRSCSSGEGVWGRGASLREAASPPESPSPGVPPFRIPSFHGILAGLGKGRGACCIWYDGE